MKKYINENQIPNLINQGFENSYTRADTIFKLNRMRDQKELFHGNIQYVNDTIE